MKTLFLSVLLLALPLQALSAEPAVPEKIAEVKKEAIIIYEGVTYRVCISSWGFRDKATQKLTKDGTWVVASDDEEKRLKELGSSLSGAHLKGQLVFLKKK